MDSQTDSEVFKLYQKVRPIIWVLQISGIVKGEEIVRYGTGFSVTGDGLLMSCAHLFREFGNTFTIKVRTLNTNGFEGEASIEFMRQNWDLALLRVGGLTDCSHGELATNGTIFQGQTLLHLGHPHEFVGSFLLGHAAYQCIEDVDLPTRRYTCNEYASTALTSTPQYRIMGHIWNYYSFVEGKRYTYEKNLHPLLPIIQCNGFTCGVGCSGGPVFNTQGEIVGILVLEADGYQIAVHVTLLREFLRLALESQQCSIQANKEHVHGRASSSKGDSKKAKRGI